MRIHAGISGRPVRETRVLSCFAKTLHLSKSSCLYLVRIIVARKGEADMDIFSLKVFVSAARNLNFTKAADEFFTTQPAVSRRISELEKELGFQLFRRSNHGVLLTKSGELFLPFAQKAVDTLQLGITTVHDILHTRKRRITVRSITPMISPFLPAVIQKFSVLNPDVEFDIVRMSSKQIRESLPCSNETDIYIGEESDLLTDGSWETSIIKTDPLKLIVRSSEQLNTPEEIKTFVQTHRAIMLPAEDAHVLVSLSKKALLAYGSDPANWLEAKPIESVLFNVSSGIGYSIMPKNHLLLAAFDLKLVPIEFDEHMNMAIAYRKNAPAFIHQFTEAVKSHILEPHCENP